MKAEIKDRIGKVKNRKAPFGYKITKDGIYPVDWNYIRLGDYLEKYTEKSKNDGKTPILTSSRNGLMLQKDYYANREVTVSKESEYGILPRGYFTYRHMSDDLIFKFNINNLVDRGLISPEYPVFTTKGMNDYYLLQKLNEGNEFKKFAIIQKKGSTRTRMYFSILEDLEIICPNEKEQTAIANILSIWDKAIELKEKLIQQKKEQKRWLMEKLLTGEVRLSGFDGDWEEYSLSDLGEFKTSSVDKKNKPDEKKIKLVNYKDVYNNRFIDDRINFMEVTAKESQIENSKLIYGDVLFTPSSETADDIGHSAVFKLKDDILFSYHLVRMRCKVEMNIDFKGYIFNSQHLLNQFSIRATGVTRFTLSIKDFNEMKIKIPPLLKEQAAIAEVLCTFDKEIDLLGQELKAVNIQKKGLMQLLLTGIVRVKV